MNKISDKIYCLACTIEVVEGRKPALGRVPTLIEGTCPLCGGAEGIPVTDEDDDSDSRWAVLPG